jgi:predicted XRE-type DNA-binding protein
MIRKEVSHMTFDIKIFDTSGNHIADYMQASIEDVLKFIRKNMIVVNQLTNEQLTESQLLNMVGVSECPIQM